MKTTFDTSELVLNALNVSALTTKITGKVCLQNERDLNSKTEDVVVNSTTISASNVQRSIVNINIYVADKKVEGNDTVYHIPNTAKLKEITNLATGLLNGFKGKYWKENDLQIEWISGLIQEPVVKQHYVNIRCIVRMHNIN